MKLDGLADLEALILLRQAWGAALAVLLQIRAALLRAPGKQFGADSSANSGKSSSMYFLYASWGSHKTPEEGVDPPDSR